MSQLKKKILFVDDDPSLLELVQTILGEYAGAAWEILIAAESSTALALLQQHQIDLLIIDVHMPVVDGLQFLKFLQRKFPNVLKVVLTGDSSGAYRTECLNNGAELFLEKPRAVGGWQSIYATLNELVKFQPEDGFRGVLRRVGLQDVLQMECLSRNSSVLEVTADDASGTIFIEEGAIIHAQIGERQGEAAFNLLLTLTGGEFQLQPFSPPAERTIEGSWESLLMEAARQRDEAVEQAALDAAQTQPAPETMEVSAEMPSDSTTVEICAAATLENESSNVLSRPQIDELVICSSQGDVLHEWQCGNTSARINFLEFLSQKSRQLAQGLPIGRFERLEVEGGETRVIAQLQADRALLVRTSMVPIELESRAASA